MHSAEVIIDIVNDHRQILAQIRTMKTPPKKRLAGIDAVVFNRMFRYRAKSLPVKILHPRAATISSENNRLHVIDSHRALSIAIRCVSIRMEEP